MPSAEDLLAAIPAGGCRLARRPARCRAIPVLEWLEHRIACSVGDLDTTFNPDGPVPGVQTIPVSTTDLFGNPASLETYPDAVTVQPDGDVIMVGTAGQSSVFAVIRLTEAGQLDGTFGTSGLATVGFAEPGTDPTSVATSIALQPNGDILVAGYASGNEGGPSMFVVARLTAVGASTPPSVSRVR